MVSNLEIRGAEVEIIRDYFFGGGGGNRDFIRKFTMAIQSLRNLQDFIRVAKEGRKRGCFSPRDENFAMGATRILCVSSLKAMHANEWDGGGIGTIGSIRGKNSEGLASISRRN